MKKIFTYIILISFLMTAAFFPASASASIGSTLVTVGIATAAGCIFGPWGCAAGAAAGIFGFKLTSLGDKFLQALIDFTSWIVNGVANFIFSLIIPLVIRLLNMAITINTDPLTTFKPVLDATQVARDFANLMLVAILIIIAMATIVGIESYGIRKTLLTLVMTALIVNFSTVIVGLSIDAGNTVMRFFWESSNFKDVPMDVYIIQNMKLSQALARANQGDIEKIFDNTSVSDFNNTSAALAKVLMLLLVMLIGLLALYIFIRLALVFIIRIAAVWIMLITAPIVFILGIVPYGKGYLQDWWRQLFNWSFLGPVVFFFFFFGLMIWAQLNSYLMGGAATVAQGNVAYAAGEIRDAEAFSFFLVFPIVIFFWQHALSASKKMAGEVANAIVDSAISIGKGVALGGAALLGGAAMVGVGGKLLTSTRTQGIARSLQQSRFRPMQKAGARLEREHIKQVGKETERAGALYKGLDDLDAPNLISRWDKFDARQKVTAAKILMERNESLPQNIAQEALTLAPSIDKTVERQLKRSAFHARYDKTGVSAHDSTNHIDVASAYQYMLSNKVGASELAPEALKNPAIAGLLNMNRLHNIARNGSPQQIKSVKDGLIALSGNPTLQEAIAAKLGIDPDAYKKIVAEMKKKLDESLFETSFDSRI